MRKDTTALLTAFCSTQSCRQRLQRREPFRMRYISNKGRLVVTAVADIAICGYNRPVKANKIRDRLHLPSRRALEPILRVLVHAGILVGVHGKNGGYRLARKPHSISVLDILCASGALGRCIDELDDSESIVAASLAADEELARRLRETTVADLMRVAATQCDLSRS